MKAAAEQLSNPSLGDKRSDELIRWLAAIVDSSEDAILSKNLDGIITSWNSGAERIFGYTADEIIGRPITVLMPPDRFDEEPDILGRVRKGERIDHYETIRRRKDGSLLNISLTVSPIKDAFGRVIGASKIARDITVNKQQQEALRRAMDRLAGLNEELLQAKAELETKVDRRTAELRQTNDQLEELVYTIAHDLRAPLRAMQAFASLLLDDNARQLDQSGRDYLNRIVRASSGMDSMVHDLLTYGRIARAEILLRPVSVQAAWDKAILQNEKAIQETGARVQSVPPLPEVVANEATLTQVMANLVSNGLKFVAPDVQPEIRLSAEPAGSNHVKLCVRDNGIGIPSQHHERIFRVFERLDGDRYPGTGIGLSIVRKAIDRMGGRVGVESAPGLGSRFWIELQRG